MNTSAVDSAAGECPVTGRRKVALAETSLSDPKIQARPQDFYWTMRTGRPRALRRKIGDVVGVALRRYRCAAGGGDPETYSDKHGYAAQYASGFFEEFKQILERDGGGFFPDAIKSDPPEHTRIRKLLDGAFTAHRVKTLEPNITRIIADLVDKLAAKAADGATIDGVQDFAIPLTIAVICEQMGLGQYNAKNIQAWSGAITAQIGRMQNREQMVANANLVCDLQNFIIAQMKDREETPREDMISDLVHATLADGGEADVWRKRYRWFVPLIIAGNDTTATAIGNMLFVLATQPQLAQQLYDNIDDERYLNRFVEELLRFAPPVRGLAKMTTRETVLGGQKLPKDAHMLVLYASGNADEKQFDCPHQFDQTRGNVGVHVAFGVGIHRCVGASLARMEIKVAARELLKRIASVKLAVPADDMRDLPTVATHSIEALPLTLTIR